MTLDKLFLALHVFGTFVWIGGLFGVISFLDVTANEPDAAARGRLVAYLRKAAIVPDVGATIALVFGAHWLFRFKLYEATYMHAKLGVVARVLGLHVYLRLQAKRARTGEPAAPHPALRPLLSLCVLGILVFVLAKIPS
jgi:uncharacterized membrane protein